MKAVLNNPYRLMGVLAGASAKEIQKQKGKINAFTKVGKPIVFDTDFTALGPLTRTESTLQQAYSRVEQNSGRLKYSLFWFVEIQPLDKIALEYLKQGEWAKAEEIWSKPVSSGVVSSRNWSAFNNLGSLGLAEAFENGGVDHEVLAGAIWKKVALLSSPHFSEFVSKTTDEQYRANPEEETKKFFDEVIATTYNHGAGIRELTMMIGKLDTLPSFALDYLQEKLTGPLIRNIEQRIEECSHRRNGNDKEALIAGKKLHRQIWADFQSLKKLLPGDDLHFQLLADSLAKELLQCGVSYWHEYSEREDEGAANWQQDVLKLTKQAARIAVGNEVSERVKENLDALQEWIDDKPAREKLKMVMEPLSVVVNHLEATESVEMSIQNARTLVNSCLPKLKEIKLSLGVTNGSYLSLSSAVVSRALDFLVADINHIQDQFGPASPVERVSLILELQTALKKAWETTKIIGQLDMVHEVRQRFEENNRTLRDLMNRLDVSMESAVDAARARRATTSSSSSSSSGGCYVATLAYGSYDHPEVRKLRRFRDGYLEHRAWGRQFVSWYYRHSPQWVARLKPYPWLHRMIRTSLSFFTRYLP